LIYSHFLSLSSCVCFLSTRNRSKEFIRKIVIPQIFDLFSFPLSLLVCLFFFWRGVVGWASFSWKGFNLHGVIHDKCHFLLAVVWWQTACMHIKRRQKEGILCHFLSPYPPLPTSHYHSQFNPDQVITQSLSLTFLIIRFFQLIPTGI
jgi:hypothetical protein